MPNDMRENQHNKARALDAKMRDPNTADNMDVRKAILAKIKSGEISLPQGQKELAAIQRAARKAGKPTAFGS